MSERTPDYTSRMPGEEQRITEQAVRLAALHYRDNMDADHAMGLEIFVEWDDPEMPETLVGYTGCPETRPAACGSHSRCLSPYESFRKETKHEEKIHSHSKD